MVQGRERRGRAGRLIRLALLLFAAPALAAGPLPALDAERSFTVSGLSSGAYMAVQLHVAHSARVKGVGAIAGGPYNCAQGTLWGATTSCMTPGRWSPLPGIGELKSYADAWARSGRIDPTSNISGARLWLFSGSEDRTVLPEVVRGLGKFYQAYEAKPLLVMDKRAGHGMPTVGTGNACDVTAAPYINNCGYDAAGALLQHLLGPLSPPGGEGRLAEFDQGWVFIPAACEKERCRVHVAFHGCRQTAKEFAEGAGYNRWAGANRLIVLYPQVKASWWPYNPRGCWDWWGYTGALYATKEGAQPRAVMRMVDRLSAPRRSP